METDIFEGSHQQTVFCLFKKFEEIFIEIKTGGMAELTFLSKKRKISLTQHSCCFCFEQFGDIKPTSLDIKGLETLLEVCRERTNDETSSYLLDNEHEIRNGNIVVKYHKSCRSAFLRPLYQNKLQKSDKDCCIQSSSETFTRSKDCKQSFDWKQCCFICGEKCLQKKRSTWSLVESATNTSSSMYSKVLEVAQSKNDQSLLKRLISVNGDLVAAEARYHRKKGCLVRYLKKTIEKQVGTSTEKENLDTVTLQLIDTLKEDIEQNGKVFEVPEVKCSFLNLCKEKGLLIDTIKTKTLKRLFHKYWPEVKFISRPGHNTIVCASSVSFEEAMSAACKYGKLLSTITEENVTKESLSNSFVLSEDDDLILHRAAGILRERINKIEKLDGQYFSYEETSLEEQKKFVSDDIYKFFCWVTNKKQYENTSDINADLEPNPKILALCCDVINASTSILTPKHLGLSVHLHHLYGSRKLIDDLNVLGYTMSYSEVRCFLSSAAVHMASKQTTTESGALVPANIMHHEDGGKLIIAAGDNWDHNEYTKDGKNTTHAMTTILVSPKSNRIGKAQRITRIPEKTIDSSSLPGGNLTSVLTYQKPNDRPRPYFRSPPSSKDEVKLPEPEAAKVMKMKELLYNLSRLHLFCDDRFEKTPPWTIFQSQISSDQLAESSDVVFNPIIMSTPTHYNTVYTTLKRIKEQMNALGQSNCPVFFDMGLLTKALEVVWARQPELSGVIPMEGGMHFLMAVFAGVGFLYGEAGLRELLSDSEVFAGNTVKQILAGKDFDRGISALLMVDEVLTARLLINFQKWCESRNVLFHDGSPLQSHSGDLSDVLSFLDTSVAPLLEEFRMKGRELSPTFRFWDDYLMKVSTPFKLFLSSSRHAEWEVYEYSKSVFLPFFFASNRTVYAKYMPYMVLSMQTLPEDVKNSFSSGSFVTKLRDGKFNSVWFDYCLEVTENKSLKSNGGIIGLTRQDHALCRWFLARPMTAMYSNTFTSKGLGRDDGDDKATTGKSHHTDNPSYRKTYDENIKKMQVMFEQAFLDPFCIEDPPNKLVNFATGVSMEPEVERSLLNCFQKGSECLDKFVEERFVMVPGKNFYDPVPKANTKTMSQKPKRIRLESKELPINGEEMYLRLLSINSFKKVPLKRVMAFENAPVPLSLFTDSGEILSTKKADFMLKLEELVSEKVTRSVGNVDCIIYDGMAVVQMLQTVYASLKLYREMADAFWQFILSKSSTSTNVHVVFDSYLDNSAKSQTRMKRGEDQSGCKTFVIQPEMQIVDVKQSLSNTNFKKEITKFYTLYLAQNSVTTLKAGQTVVVSGGLEDKVLSITSECVSYVPDLCTNQEEADTKMLLHSKYAADEGAQTLTICSPDTDVLLLLLHHFNALTIPRVFFRTGRKSIHTDMTRYIPVHEIFVSLSPEQRHILLPVYCITGCDTCSSFFGIGKRSAFKLMMSKASLFEGMGCLGDVPDLTSVQINACTKFVGELYGQPNCTSLTMLRVEKVLKNKSVSPRRLPPTDDSFLLHLQRCLLQLIVWKSALLQSPVVPSLISLGYITDATSGLAVPQFMAQPAAAPELLSDLVCNCVDLCESSCCCASAEQPCTTACECKAFVDDVGCCKNIYTYLSCAVQD
ncbi:uncharacterized protein LOC123541526 [Mercenaria mercenaria]|uniref:uncharacterized protein LOC123541526 n=1 Tax=Mercenaria mercenaria TaxID=6596 RepID=UPI00234E6803|nr:uncharacterized protein LOC123541526 [Mercenaria mercenaria]